MKRLLIFAPLLVVACSKAPLQPSKQPTTVFTDPPPTILYMTPSPTPTPTPTLIPRANITVSNNLIGENLAPPNPLTALEQWAFPVGVFPDPINPPRPGCKLGASKPIYEVGEDIILKLDLINGPAYAAYVMGIKTLLPSSVINIGKAVNIGANTLGAIVIGPYDYDECSVTVQVLAPETYLDFGGMFGYENGGLVPNPATGGESCPLGYTANRIYGSHGIDWPIILCSRIHQPGIAPVFDFGGMYGFGAGGTLFPNPISGGMSCPSGYLAQTVNSADGLDWKSVVCYRPKVAGIRSTISFGGAWGLFKASAKDASGNFINESYLNPATGKSICPVGHTSVKVKGSSPAEDLNLFYCYR